jgi:hypothetical protein
MADLTPVQQQLAALLTTNHLLTVRWDCGGDQSFVTTEIDGQEAAADYHDPTNLPVLLDQYLTDLLELPEVGDFEMQGRGRIFLDGATVLLDYQSDYRDYNDPNDYLSAEEWRELGVEPFAQPAAEETPKAQEETPNASTTTFDQDMSADYSGRRVLFQLA